MDRWAGKVCVVTGASSGIGAAIVKDLVKAGCIVVGLARRAEKIEELKDGLEDYPGKLFARECDVTKLEMVKETFEWIDEELGAVSVLINNAAVSRFTLVLNEDEEQDASDIINTNITGLVFCTKKAYKSMVKYDCEGYIINVGSVFGHNLYDMCGSVEVYQLYAPTKFAVRVLGDIMRLELNRQKNAKVRVTNISPGLVKTEMVDRMPNSDQLYAIMPYLNSEEVSEQIIHILSMPPHINIHDLIIRAVGSF